jgi:zinc transport system substrate-binding protein
MYYSFFLSLCIPLLCTLTGCGKSPAPREKPTVLVTLAPYAHVVKRIAGDLVHVETLIPEGANPHLYEAPPQAVKNHQNADLWIYLGEGFDRKMLQFLKETEQKILTLDVAEGLDLLPGPGLCACCHSQEGRDLHIWLSPQLMKPQAQRIATALASLLPDHEPAIQEGLQHLLIELDALHISLAGLLSDKKGEVVMVSHPALGYFCREFGLEQVSIEIEGKDPRPKQIAEMLSLAKQRNVRTIFTEPQHSSKGAQVLALELGIPTEQIDPYTENYPDMLGKLAQAIAQ